MKLDGFEDPARTQPPSPKRRFGLPFWAVVAGIGILVTGNFHFFTGSDVGFKVMRKVSFSLSETWVNLDELGNMPAIMARAKYPLTIKAMAIRALEAGAERDLGPQAIARLSLGMNPQEVHQILGFPKDSPSEYSIGGKSIEHWHYSSQLQGRFVSLEFTDRRLTKITD